MKTIAKSAVEPVLLVGVLEVAPQDKPGRLRIADLLSKGIFLLLLILITLAAVPYGTFEPWWKSAFICVIFFLAALAIIEALLSEVSGPAGWSVLLPMLALTFFGYLQTLSFRPAALEPALKLVAWNSVSADPYSTRFVVLQLLALTIALALFYRYFKTASRIQILIYVILGVAVASAIFGILRQTLQHEPGFLLPLTKPDLGYGQFLNKNHFAFMMEMAFGLGLGMILSGGVSRDKSMVYVASLLPVWMALVLSNSRGGVLAMLSQVLIAVCVLANVYVVSAKHPQQARFIRIARSFAFRIILIIALFAGLLAGTVWVGGDRLLGSFEAVRSELTPGATGLNEGATRNEIWRATLRMFAAHPVLGVGLGGYWIAITAYHDASGMLTPQEAHNDYLELLSSGGIVGFAIGVWFALALVQMIRRKFQSADPFQRSVSLGAVFGIAGVAVHSMVDFGLHMFANALIFLALIMMATSKLESQNESDPCEH
jgi:O-antigen ligase